HGHLFCLVGWRGAERRVEVGGAGWGLGGDGGGGVCGDCAGGGDGVFCGAGDEWRGAGWGAFGGGVAEGDEFVDGDFGGEAVGVEGSFGGGGGGELFCDVVSAVRSGDA